MKARALSDAARGARAGTIAFAIGLVSGACSSSSVLSTSPAPAKCQVSVSTAMGAAAAGGGTGSVAINTERECAWEGAAAVEWIALTSTATGRGAGQLEFRVLANPDAIARKGSITVNDERVDINQAAAACQVSVATHAFTLGIEGGTQTVPVTAPGGCTWTASSETSWIIVSAASGSGSGRLTFTVEPNAGAARSGKLAIAGETITIEQATAGAACAYAISPLSQTVAAPGGTGSVTVTAAGGCSWSAASNAAWISVSAGSTGAGTGSVSFTASPNTGPARSGTITVAGQIFTMNQAESVAAPPAPPCSYAISAAGASMSSASAAGTVAVTATSGCSWTATSNVEWVVVTAGSSGTGSGSVAFAVGANAGARRSGTLNVAGHTFTVEQAAAPAASCSYAINPLNASMGAGAGAGTPVSVTAGAGCAWTASSNASWIKIGSGSTGSGNGSIGFDVTANIGAARSGTVTIAGQTFTVNQATGCSYAINPASASIAAAGGSGPAVAVASAAGCAWTTVSNATWITVTSGSSDSGNGTVHFKMDPNTGAARSGTLTIAGQTFTVNQAVSCSYAINPANVSVAAAAGNGPVVTVTATEGCSWTAKSDDPWIVVTSATSGTGNGSVTFKVSANGAKQRTGTLTIAGKTFTVTQQKE
jgi:hypothetical protein